MDALTKLANKEFKIFFHSKEKLAHTQRRYFALGAGSLSRFIGQEFAEKMIKKAMNSTDDKMVFKLRTKGAIIFYCK